MTLLTDSTFTDDLESVEVLVLDAHDASRIGLGVLLQREAWVERCVVASDEQRARVLASRGRPAVAAVDVSRVGPFAGALVASLRDARPGLQIVLTSRAPGVVIANPRQFGASAFVPAESPVATTIAALRAAAYGEPVEVPAVHSGSVRAGVGARAAAAGLSIAASSDDPVTSALSRRERDVLALLATGATNREIAAQLYLGPDTVKKHASSLYRKLGVRNRTEATQQAAGLLAVG